MLRRIRQILAVAGILMVTLLFLDFTGTLQAWFGWMAKIQFLPALLALNVAVVVGLVVFTLLLGRVYCSVICPLGVMQDVFGWFGKKARKNRYKYSKAITWLRVTMLVVMVAALLAGAAAIVALLAPYSAYGRIAQSFFAPVWAWCNNLLATWAESRGSYEFYTVDVWLRGWVTLAVAALTLIVLGVLAWRNGRTYCNTICPVGTVLGFLSRFSLFRPVIDTSDCAPVTARRPVSTARSIPSIIHVAWRAWTASTSVISMPSATRTAIRASERNRPLRWIPHAAHS